MLTNFEPSYRSAALAGALTGIGGLAMSWFEAHPETPSFTRNLSLVLLAIAFFVLPIYFLVIGPRSGKFSRTWFLDGDERTRYLTIMKRGLVWFLAVFAVGTIVAILHAIFEFLM